MAKRVWVKVSSSFCLQKEGDVLEGVYLGEGKPKVMKPRKGEKKGSQVATYRVVDDNGVEHEVLGSAQLGPFFQGLKPKTTAVRITRGPQVDGGQGRVNTYTLEHAPA